MKIGNPADKRPLTSVDTVPAKTKGTSDAAPAQPAAGAADPSAKVQLSNTAETLMSGAGTAEFDAEKVDRIAKAIQDGTYQIHADVVADKLIANAQELLGKVPR